AQLTLFPYTTLFRSFIYREGNSRYIGVGFSIEGRDLGSTIAEAKETVAREVKLPQENHMEWAGEFESKERAAKQLALVVPISLRSEEHTSELQSREN